MHAIEALNEQLKKCEPCRVNAFIIEFEQLPENIKKDFAHYDKEKYYILYCEPCKVYKLLPE